MKDNGTEKCSKSQISVDAPCCVVIFLDVDGVLNSHEYFMSDRFDGKDENYPNNHIDPKAVETLNTLFETIDCEIVLSSTWRILESNRSVVENEAGIKSIFRGVTPSLARKLESGLYRQQQRGEEIQKWVAENNPEKYVILDDDSDMLESQRQNFIKIDHEKGLQPEHIERAIKILST